MIAPCPPTKCTLQWVLPSNSHQFSFFTHRLSRTDWTCRFKFLCPSRQTSWRQKKVTVKNDFGKQELQFFLYIFFFNEKSFSWGVNFFFFFQRRREIPEDPSILWPFTWEDQTCPEKKSGNLNLGFHFPAEAPDHCQGNASFESRMASLLPLWLKSSFKPKHNENISEFFKFYRTAFTFSMPLQLEVMHKTQGWCQAI